MAANALLLFFSFSFFCVATAAAEGVLFSKIPRTLIVTASLEFAKLEFSVLKAGEDKFTVTWQLNQSVAAGDDAAYKEVKVRLCYAPVSQKDRGWRKTFDDLKKDKTCQFGVTLKPYTKSKTSFEYSIERDVPTATYFVRAYVLDSGEAEVAYGETTNADKTTNLFLIKGITGRHASMDIAAGCFSAFSILSLLFFFVLEKRKVKK